MSLLLVAAALLIPTLLVVQVVRGRVRVQCCSTVPEADARMRAAVDGRLPGA